MDERKYILQRSDEMDDGTMRGRRVFNHPWDDDWQISLSKKELDEIIYPFSKNEKTRQ